MPSPTIDQLLQRAIPHATEDRLSLEDAYSNEGEVAEECKRFRKAILGLKGRPLSTLDEAGQELAMKTFLYAEQHEQSVVDALAGAGFDASRRKALVNATLYRKHRLSTWGMTRLEMALENTPAVPIREVAGLLLARQNAERG